MATVAPRTGALSRTLSGLETIAFTDDGSSITELLDDLATCSPEALKEDPTILWDLPEMCGPAQQHYSSAKPNEFRGLAQQIVGSAAGKARHNGIDAAPGKADKAIHAGPAEPPACPMRGVSEICGGGTLDAAILTFFKTDEFAEVIAKVEKDLHGVDLSDPMALFGSDDLMDLPLMEDFHTVVPEANQIPRTAGRKVRKPKKVKAPKRGKTDQGQAPSAKRRKPAKVEEEPDAFTQWLSTKTPRPEHYNFQLQPTAAKADEFRRARLRSFAAFKAKRLAQKLNPTVRYKSRRKIADARPRVKGRFVKTSEEITAA